ncbi:MAG: GHKL domain-containing protein [Lachnospiraceae bacterium]|nr:GHKL domain-containing protein [Lachnospiraceae bacterium]
MTYLGNIVISLFDIFTLSTYYSHFFHSRKSKINGILFWGVYIAGEALIFINTLITAGNNSLVKGIFTTSFVFLITFAISFLYESPSLFNRFLINILYQTIAVISEFIAAGFIYLVRPKIFKTPGLSQDTLVSFSGQLIVFLFVICVCTIQKRKDHQIPLKHMPLLLFIPIISLFLMDMFFFANINEIRFERIVPIASSLLAINAICFILFDKTSENYELNKQLEHSKRQLEYQASKYNLISDAYKQTRGIVHDIKKYNRLVRSCVAEERYGELLDLIEENESSLKKNITLINTGNLVIDSFVTNYIFTAKQENIQFNYLIDIDKENVPIENYDLCIILGNLLDNSFEACRKIKDDQPKKISLKIHISGNFFVIYIANTYDTAIPDTLIANINHELIHGYGTLNIRKTVDKHHGFYYAKAEDIYEATVSLPLKK